MIEIEELYNSAVSREWYNRYIAGRLYSLRYNEFHYSGTVYYIII